MTLKNKKVKCKKIVLRRHKSATLFPHFSCFWRVLKIKFSMIFTMKTLFSRPSKNMKKLRKRCVYQQKLNSRSPTIVNISVW